MDRHIQGILLITLSTVAFSSAGFFTRLIQLDAWTILFWRGWFGGLMILCIIVAQERGQTRAAVRAIGRRGLAIALCSTASTVLFINALQWTSVANVVVIFAAAPFLTAGLGRLWFGIIEAWTTLAASLVAMLGVGILVGGAAAEGHLFGNLCAVGATCCIAVMMLILRQQHETSMLPAACLSALLCPILAWPFTSPLHVSTGEIVNLFLFGTIQFGLGLAFLTVGGRWVSATENALISTLEVPLAVAWVWLFFGEVPSRNSIAGGIVIMVAVAAHVLCRSRSRQAAI